MASTRERAWLAAHQKGSKALVQRLDKAHANNPEYQAFKKKHGLGDTSSVKQVSKSTVDRAKEKARQTLAGKAYGATKGTRMGSAEGTGETLRDTIAPLTRDQHSAVKAAEREAKAAEKPAAAPKKPAKPKKEKAAAPEKKKPSALELIAAAAAKRKINQPPVSAKALRRIAAVGDMEHDHGGFEDLGDTQYGGRGSYNEEAIVEGGNYGKPYNNDEDLKSKSNTELQSLHKFWTTRIEKDPNHSRAKDQLTKIKAILAGKIGKKTNEEVELDEVAKWRTNPKAHDVDTDGSYLTKTHDKTDPLKSRAEYLSTAKDYIRKNIKNVRNASKQSQGFAKSAIKMFPQKEEVEQVDEGMLDDYIEGKIAKHHANKYNPEIDAAHADVAEFTKKIKPFDKKIAQIKKRVSYKDKTHKNYAKTRADLKDAAAAIQPLSAERSKHYDRIRDARNKRDSNIDSDVETYHKWGVVGLGAKKLKQKLTKEEVELDEAYDVNAHAEKIHKRVTNPRNLDRINTFAEIKKAYTAGRGKTGFPLFHSDVVRIPGYSLVDSNANGKHPNVSRIARGLLAAHNAGKKSVKEEIELSEMDSEGYRGTSEPHHSSYAGKKWVEAKPITPEQAVKGASRIFKDILKKQSKPVKEEAEQVDEMKSSNPKGIAYKITAASHAANPSYGPHDPSVDPKTNFGAGATRSSAVAGLRAARAIKKAGGNPHDDEHIETISKAIHGSPSDYDGASRGWSKHALTSPNQSPEQKERRSKLTGGYGGLSHDEKEKDRQIARVIANRVHPVKEEVEQIDEMKYGIGTVVKLKKPIDGHEYATVKGFTSSGSTSGPTGRGVPMPAGKVKKVKVALRKNDDHSYYAGPVTHIEHDDVHSVIRESAPGWMLRQNPELAKKVKAKKKLARNRQKQMGNPEPVREAKKHRMGGALFADTAARLQKAINAHKERMDQMTNGPEHEYHHPTLDIRAKSRLKFPAPWVKVEDK